MPTKTLPRTSPDPWDQMSAEWLEILELIGSGWTDAEIAVELDVSLSSVRYAVRTCMLQVGARNRPNLMLLAVSAGAIEPD